MFFTLPLPPGLNQTYGTNKSGHFYKKTRVKDWEEEVGWMIKEQKKGMSTFGEKCAVKLAVFFNPTFEPDIDAYIKVTLDRLEKMLIIANDRLIYDLHVRKCPANIKKRIEITITSLSHDEVLRDTLQ